MAKRDLDFIGSKEPSRTRMYAMPKSQHIAVCTDQVCLLVLTRRVAHSRKAVCIEIQRIFVVIGIPLMSRIADDLGAFLENVAVGKSDIGKSCSPEHT